MEKDNNMLKEFDEDELVESVRNGNTEAYRYLVEAYTPRLTAYFASRLQNSDEIQDLVQETFIVGYRNLNKFAERSQFSTWLIGIARNKLLSHLRTVSKSRDRKTSVRAELLMNITPEFDKAQSTSWKDYLSQLRHCLDQLSPHIRETVERRYFYNEPVQSISTSLGRSASAVRAMMTRARQTLKSCIAGVPNE